MLIKLENAGGTQKTEVQALAIRPRLPKPQEMF